MGGSAGNVAPSSPDMGGEGRTSGAVGGGVVSAGGIGSLGGSTASSAGGTSVAGSGGSVASTGGEAGSAGTDGAYDGGAAMCSSDKDCPASQVCGYEADLTCSTHAHCIPSRSCHVVTVGCGCDGGVVLVSCGVASRAFSADGPCAGGTGVADGVSVSVDSFAGTAVAPCASGYAHPSICCQGIPNQPTTCTEDVTHPFDVCGAEEMAYPDSSICCSLDSLTACLQPSGGQSEVDAGLPFPCVNPCDPGAYPPPPFYDSSLCVYGTGLLVEPACKSGSGSFSSSAPDAAPDLDAGPVCKPISYCTTECPAGWSTPAGGQVDLCCMKDSSGQSFCFSQAGSIGPARPLP